MPKIHQLQTNFTAGEFSEKMLGRVDYARYANSLKKQRNCYSRIQGGSVRREGFKHVATGATVDSRLIPFVFDSANAYVLEFQNALIRVYKNSGLITTFASPFLAADDLFEIRYTQTADTMVLTHPKYPPKQVIRKNDTAWSIDNLAFSVPPLGENGERPASNLALSALTGVINVSLGVGTFLAGDVGRQIAAGSGLGTITAQAGATATVDVVNAFDALSYVSQAWAILDSSTASVTPSGVATGSTITLTASVAAWRSTDVGKYVLINDGVVLITVFTSTTVVYGRVIIALSSTTIAYGGAWRLMSSAFSAVTGYPVAVTMFEGRLVFGGTAAAPNTLWFSRINNIRDFALGVNAASAMEWQVTSDRLDQILHLVPSRSLLVHTYSAEFAVYGTSGGSVTPTTTVIRMQSSLGCSSAAPESIGLNDIFIQRSEKKIRASGYSFQSDGYESTDIGEVADHLFSIGVKEVCFIAEPVPRIVCALADGSMLMGTFAADQQVMAWSKHTTDGVIRSVCTIPYGGVDELWAVITRNGTTRVERLNEANYHDSGAIFTGTALTSVSMPWLAGLDVELTIDGQYAGAVTADGAGLIALPFAGDVINAGLLFVATMELLPPEFQIDATIQGKRVGVNAVMVRVLNTSALKVNGQQLLNRRLGAASLNSAMPLITGDVEVSTLGIAVNGSDMIIEQGNPSPFHVLAVRRTLTVND